MEQQNDEDLIKAAKNGDMRAFGVIVERNEGKVAGVVKSMLGDTPEAIDVGQEVFIRFYKALENFKGQSTLSTYLLRIAINLSLNELKSRKKRNSLFRSEEAGLHISADHTQSDLNEAVRHEVDQLDADFKAVVTLRMIEGYSTEETADMLKIPIGTALSRLARAQKKLKTMLSKYLDQ